MDSKYILALDQGTTSSRAVLVNRQGELVDQQQKEFTQHFPNAGWVEHDPMEIWASQKAVLQQLLLDAQLKTEDIVALGITNQRETTIIWDRSTGQPVFNAIVWQDRRTASFCDDLRKKGYADQFREKTGLILDAYFSGTKIHWILENVAGLRERAEAGELAFGTVDSWLIWNLTGGAVHATDVTNASRTLLFNIHTLEWDEDLLRILNIPRSLLPEVKGCSEEFGVCTVEGVEGIKITGVAGDQQAALFGQLCTEPGTVKNTYGTGCFLMVNTGTEAVTSKNHRMAVKWENHLCHGRKHLHWGSNCSMAQRWLRHH